MEEQNILKDDISNESLFKFIQENDPSTMVIIEGQVFPNNGMDGVPKNFKKVYLDPKYRNQIYLDNSDNTILYQSQVSGEGNPAHSLIYTKPDGKFRYLSAMNGKWIEKTMSQFKQLVKDGIVSANRCSGTTTYPEIKRHIL